MSTLAAAIPVRLSPTTLCCCPSMLLNRPIFKVALTGNRGLAVNAIIAAYCHSASRETHEEVEELVSVHILAPALRINMKEIISSL